MWYLVIHDGLVLFTRHTSLYFYQTQTDFNKAQTSDKERSSTSTTLFYNYFYYNFDVVEYK